MRTGSSRTLTPVAWYDGGDGRGDTGEADLADVACAVLAHQRVGNVEEVDVDCGQIRAGGDDVIREVVVDGVAVARVVDGLFEEPHADTHDDRAETHALLRSRAVAYV